ncbi:MAG: nucleotide exchange factor GrpE [Gammaproteobacteria bacterium]
MSKKKATAKSADKKRADESPADNTVKTGGESPDTAKADAAQDSSAPAGDNQAAETPPPPPTMEEIAKELAETKDLHLRAIADADNQRKRAEEQITKVHQFAVQAFATGICEVRDCLETAFNALTESDKAHQGIDLTLRKLDGVMDQHGVRPVRPDNGAPFDPNLHQSIGVAENKDLPPNSVATLIQCGYTLNGRTIRAALVHLNKAAADNNGV